VIAGSGIVSERWSVPAVAPYVRQVASKLGTLFGIQLDETAIAEFRSAAERAVGDVNAIAVLALPGTGQEGVYTNDFLAVRVESAEVFLRHAADAMGRWNAMLDKAKDSVRIVFDSRPVTIGGHQGTEYSFDMAAAVGAPALPDIRQTMERFVGHGGRFRLQFVALDDRTVLLAAANEEQAAKAIELLGRAVPAATEPVELQNAAKLLATPAAWQLFVSPHGYNQWLKREMDAMLGPVIGGPVVRDFSESPPIGLAGGVDGRTVWAEMAAPVDTLRATGKYFTK
jgi:hypothetical protein